MPISSIQTLQVWVQLHHFIRYLMTLICVVRLPMGITQFFTRVIRSSYMVCLLLHVISSDLCIVTSWNWHFLVYFRFHPFHRNVHPLLKLPQKSTHFPPTFRSRIICIYANHENQSLPWLPYESVKLSGSGCAFHQESALFFKQNRLILELRIS